MKGGDVQREVDQSKGQKGQIALIADAHPEQIVTRADAKTTRSTERGDAADVVHEANQEQQQWDDHQQ